MNNLNAKVDSLREEIIGAVADSVKFRSVQGEPAPGAPFGVEVGKALEHALSLSAKLGFRTVNLDGYVGYAEYGEGDDYVGVLGHLDVVPEGSGWKYPPYGAEIHDGKMYGRGVIDDKGPIFAALYALKAIKDLGLPLSKKVRVIFGTNEESGFKDAQYYVEREKPPVAGFTPDGSFPVIHAEKGAFNFSVIGKLAGAAGLKALKGGERANMVADYCEAVLAAADSGEVVKACADFAREKGFELSARVEGGDVRIESRGVSAHGSTPELGVNAISNLFAFLGSRNIGGDGGKYIAAVNKCIGHETDGRSLGIAFADAPSGKLSNNVGTVELKDGVITMVCNVRFPVTYKFEQIFEPLKKTLTELGLEVSCPRHSMPLYFPKDHPLIQTLHRVFREQSGLPGEPIAIGGGTYAKNIANIVAFGPEFPGKSNHLHEPNEFIDVEDLMLCARIYSHAIYELAK